MQFSKKRERYQRQFVAISWRDAFFKVFSARAKRKPQLFRVYKTRKQIEKKMRSMSTGFNEKTMKQLGDLYLVSTSENREDGKTSDDERFFEIAAKWLQVTLLSLALLSCPSLSCPSLSCPSLLFYPLLSYPTLFPLSISSFTLFCRTLSSLTLVAYPLFSLFSYPRCLLSLFLILLPSPLPPFIILPACPLSSLLPCRCSHHLRGWR